MDKNRRARLESMIREELSMFVSRELKDPRVPALTFTQVSVTEDGRQATVFLLPFGQVEAEPEDVRAERMRDCLEGLASASGFLRRHLAKVLTIRHIPELIFKQDRGLENSLRVHEILKKLDSKPQS